jgi:hypothetical protein
MQQNHTTQKLSIPLEIETEHRLPETEAGQAWVRIDKTTFYLQSIFYFMKMAVRGHDIQETSADEIPLLTFSDLRMHLHSMCEIGEALAVSLEGSGFRSAHPHTLADHISAVLMHPNVPTDVYDALGEAMTELSNQMPMNTKEFHDSAENIARILDNYTPEDGGAE